MKSRFGFSAEFATGTSGIPQAENNKMSANFKIFRNFRKDRESLDISSSSGSVGALISPTA
ncbi:MAG: hypothetical protein KDM91_08980 [Verrucomicrobiae bacterium]|nr:hypothetical protein [Verrucomicrobiae bacterium]MCP5539996.1 hypothetical protein [Akkermansiaceae bacterium]MCP5549931.1 hypothetical protein [Akkermansiaceae bacterium]